MIGDPSSRTGVSAGNVIGILAANGSITILSANSKGAFFPNAAGTPNGAVINSIFVPGSFDQVGFDLQGLAMILTHLNNLHVGTDGNLTIAPLLLVTNTALQTGSTGTASASTTGTAVPQTGWSGSADSAPTIWDRPVGQLFNEIDDPAAISQAAFAWLAVLLGS